MGNTTVTVATGATLSGSGTVGLGSTPGVTVNGTLAPGNVSGGSATGSLTITGLLTLASGSTFSPTLYAASGPNAAAGTEVTELIVGLNGSISNLGSQLTPIGGGTPTTTSTYVLVDQQGSQLPVDPFSNAAEGSTVTVNGQAFVITYTYDAEGNQLTGGNDVALMPVATPEPGTLSLLGVASLGLLRRRRARRLA